MVQVIKVQFLFFSFLLFTFSIYPFTTTGMYTANVKDYPNPQSAIDTVVSLGGGTVFFPRGTYIIDASDSLRIINASRIAILGEEGGTIISKRSGTGTYGPTDNCILRIDGSTNITVRNIYFKGAGKNWGGDSDYGTGLFLNNSSKCNVTKCEFSDLNLCVVGSHTNECQFTNNFFHGQVGQDGIKIQLGGNGNIISNNTMNFSAPTVAMGIRLANFPTHTVVTGNTLKGMGSEAILDDDGQSFSVINSNTIDSCSYGIALKGCTNSVIAGNTISNTPLTGILLLSQKHLPVNDNLISNNILSNCGYNLSVGGAIDVLKDTSGINSRRNTITGNRIDLTKLYGIEVFADSCTISNNYLTRCGSVGIVVGLGNGFINCNIIGNTIFSNGPHGIYVYGSQLTIASNSLFGMTGSNYGIYSGSLTNSSLTGNIGSILMDGAGCYGNLLSGNTGAASSDINMNGVETIRPVSTTPANPGANSEARMYVKGGKLIVQYMEGAQIRFKYLVLTGSNTLWGATTTAP
jgi:parallel beta-helix repeat protein